jgi:hypothetical protein
MKKYMNILLIIIGLLCIAGGIVMSVKKGVVNKSINEVTLHIGEEGRVNNIALEPLELIEDSRCPEGANCFWPGRILLKTRVSYDEVTKEFDFDTSNKDFSSLTTPHGLISITEVSPWLTVGKAKPELKEYRFTFSLKKETDQMGAEQKAIEIAKKELMTLPRYQDWMKKGWEYTTSAHQGGEQNIWSVNFDVPHYATDNSILIIVDISKGTVVRTDVHME